MKLSFAVSMLTALLLTDSSFAVGGYWANRTGNGFSCYQTQNSSDLTLVSDSCQASAEACAACGGMWTGNPGVQLLDQNKEPLMPASSGSGSTKPVSISCAKIDLDGVICVKCNDASPATCDFRRSKK
jgi:hypothetical protein